MDRLSRCSHLCLPVRRPEVTSAPPTVDSCVGELQLGTAAYLTKNRNRAPTPRSTYKMKQMQIRRRPVWNVEAKLARLLGEPPVRHIQEDRSDLLLPV